MPFNPKVINLKTIIDDKVQLLSSSSKLKNIALSSNINANLEVVADENMVKAIIRNLISNAIKYTNPGGKITVDGILKANEIEITISDTGIGISKAKMKELFTSVLTTSCPGTDNEKGSGLGLNICKEFVHNHKGRIWVESQPGAGSIFSFTLPLP